MPIFEFKCEKCSAIHVELFNTSNKEDIKKIKDLKTGKITCMCGGKFKKIISNVSKPIIN